MSISDNNISVNLPSVPLRISVIGKPFSGKASVVEKLASIYCLEIINIDALISLSIKDAEIESLDGKNSTRGEIGRKIQAFMIEGQIPSDSLLVQLIIDAVQKLNPQPPDEQPQKEKGWILMNFPRTRAQAVLLEKELTGYEEPKAIKLGNLKRNNNPVKEKEKTPAIATDKKPTVDRQRSMIAAPALDVKGEVKAGSIQSGIDVVFLLDVSNETAIKRAAGTRFDSITAEKYHLEFNPPPSDVIGIHERLTGYIDDANEIDLIQNQIFAFEEQEPLLKEWFQKFSNIHVIEGSTSAEEVMFGVFGHVTRLIESKEKIEREKTVEENPVSNNVGFPPAISQIDNVSSSNANLVKDSDESKRVAASAKTEDDKKTKPTSGNAKPVAPRAASGGKNRPITSVALGKDNGKKLDQSNAVVDPLTQFADGQALLVRSVTSDGRKLPTREIAEILADRILFLI